MHTPSHSITQPSPARASLGRRSGLPLLVCREQSGLHITKPKCLIRSSLAPLAPGPPWIGKVQCSGSTRKAFGAHSRTGDRKPRTNEARKLPNKPNFVEPKGNQWFTVGFEYGGAVGSVKSDGSDQLGTRVALSRGGRACSADLALFQRPRPCAATEQQDYQTKPIPYNHFCCSNLQKVWRADRVLRPQLGRKAGGPAFLPSVRMTGAERTLFVGPDCRVLPFVRCTLPPIRSRNPAPQEPL